MGEVYDPIYEVYDPLSPFSSLYSTDVTIENHFVNMESLVTSKGGKLNHISVIQPFENMRWYLMNMMSDQLASETLLLMIGWHELYIGKSTHSSYQIHMELLCNLNV